MGKISKGTKVGDEKGLQFPTFSPYCSVTLSVRNPLIALHSYCTVQSPEVEPIRGAEMRGSSRQQPAASRGASLKRPPPHHRDGVMLGGLTLFKHGFPVLVPHVRNNGTCGVRNNVSQCISFPWK